MLDRGLKVRFSCVRTRWLAENWVGKELNDSTLAELRMIAQRIGLDPCGEEGEYHTLVTDAPQFSQAIEIRSHTTRSTDSLAYMEIQAADLLSRAR
jgi:diphthamide synthase (EF-2-diphthine--ammonia ligase)